MRVDELHEEAQRCQRLASETFDVVVREALIDLASHYERQAERLRTAKRADTYKTTCRDLSPLRV